MNPAAVQSDPFVARRRFRAPTGDDAVLVEPAAEDWQRCWQDNLQRRRDSVGSIDVAAARENLIAAAYQYTSQYRSVDPFSPSAPIAMAGHQPALIHAGVWFKNFVLSRLATGCSAVPINLIVDNDVLALPSIRVPLGDRAQPQVASIPFDRRRGVIPYELAEVIDRECFQSFGDRVAHSIRHWIEQPLIRRVWPDVLAQYARTGKIGQAFAAARHRLEGDAGLATLELPLSAICRTYEFAQFTADILLRLPEFVEIHNRTLASYRIANRIRSRTRPVPDLQAADGDWETPFWIWSAQQPGRRHLFARWNDSEIELSDHHGWTRRLPRGSLATALHQLNCGETALRPRALLTTGYSRLILSDLFIHGIGGAKYDEVTDRVMQEFFGSPLPQFLTLSATLRLPLPLPNVSQDDLRWAKRQLREIRFHPETFFSADETPPSVADLIQEKRRWIENDDPASSAHRHTAINEANRQLSERLDEQQRRWQEKTRELEQQLQLQALLGSREFSYLLFPDSLLDRLQTLAAHCCSSASQ